MTLREAHGGGTRRVHEPVDQLLDREDTLIVLLDERRAISYGQGVDDRRVASSSSRSRSNEPCGR